MGDKNGRYVVRSRGRAVGVGPDFEKVATRRKLPVAVTQVKGMVASPSISHRDGHWEGGLAPYTVLCSNSQLQPAKRTGCPLTPPHQAAGALSSPAGASGCPGGALAPVLTGNIKERGPCIPNTPKIMLKMQFSMSLCVHLLRAGVTHPNTVVQGHTKQCIPAVQLCAA